MTRADVRGHTHESDRFVLHKTSLNRCSNEGNRAEVHGDERLPELLCSAALSHPALRQGNRFNRDRQAARPNIRTTQRVGAGTRIRTGDLLITNQLLYQLSYAGQGATF